MRKRNENSFTIATKIKYLEINETKKAKDLYAEKSQYNAEEQKWRAKHYRPSGLSIKIQWSRQCGTGKRTIDKWISRTDPHKYSPLISDKRAKAV